MNRQIEKLFEDALKYCEQTNEKFERCMAMFNKNGLEYTVGVLSNAKLPSIGSAKGLTDEDRKYWGYLTSLAMGKPDVVAEHIYTSVLDWCTRGNDIGGVLECFKEYSPERFGDVIKEHFMRKFPPHVAEAVAKHISKEKWEKAKRVYEELWVSGYGQVEEAYESLS